jgi:hypothetical protein
MEKVMRVDNLCPNCGQVVFMNEKTCPSCHKRIAWSKVITQPYWIWPDGLKNHPEDPEYKDYFP